MVKVKSLYIHIWMRILRGENIIRLKEWRMRTQTNNVLCSYSRCFLTTNTHFKIFKYFTKKNNWRGVIVELQWQVNISSYNIFVLYLETAYYGHFKLYIECNWFYLGWTLFVLIIKFKQTVLEGRRHLYMDWKCSDGRTFNYVRKVCSSCSFQHVKFYHPFHGR